ncbi:MAG: hypothetical protein M3209_09645 [Acidobacteriota bacterium]|nr:hypothetical protein [Acidobacteriota bacterium]
MSAHIDQRIKEILGQLKRKDRFKNGERITLELTVEKYGAHRKMCHNCAFLPESTERQDFAKEYPSQLSTVLENIDGAVKGENPFEPFFCHREMPSDDGGKSFQPEFDDEGLPVGHKICAGWMAEVKNVQKIYQKFGKEILQPEAQS